MEQEVEPPTADIVSDNEEETDSDNEIVFEEPITVMDNEIVKVDFTGKYLEYDSHKQPDEIGYKVTVENKTDSYLMMNSMYASIDGFMLDIQAGPYTSFLAISPNSKANGELYIPLDGRTIGVDLNSLEDLKNFTATFQLALSKDGSSYSSDNMVDVPYSCTVP